MDEAKKYRELQQRSSILEFRNISTNYPVLSGFFVIFWLSSFFYFLNALVQNHKKIGLAVGLNFGRLLLQNFTQTITCLILISSLCFIPVVCQTIFGRVRLLFCTCEVLLLFGVPVLLYKNVPFQFSFIQSGLLCMISMCHFMKLHSFRLSYHPSPEKTPLHHFIVFYYSPTFTFLNEYPRNETFSLFYFTEKLLMFLGCSFLAYVLIEHFIMPVCTKQVLANFVENILQLIVPMFLVNLLLFFGIFEGLCHALAELTYFADREFYTDWWNCTNFGEFSRKWNKIVHAFLFRHIYFPLRSDFGLPKWICMFATFLFSAIMHELVMGAFSGKLKLKFFFLQMLQIPLIAISNVPQLYLNGVLGNLVVIGGLLAGPPMLLLWYLD